MKKLETPRLHSDWIDPHAYGIVSALQDKGYTTYLVGGCVRDLLLGKQPKDFDIATSATPNEVKRVIHRSYIIGRRFRLVLVKRGEVQYEVATFRRNSNDNDDLEDSPGDNFWGSPEEDSLRRDFTVNGLYYDPVSETVLDHLDGGQDLNNGIIRMIGDPDQRLIEDPIRILRAIRLAHLIKFSIEPDLKISIQKNAEVLANSALPRRREEFLKFLRLKEPTLPLLQCFDLGVLKIIAPTLHEVLDEKESNDLFLQELYSFHDSPLKTPTELFARLVLAYYRAAIEPNVEKPVRAREFLEHPKLLKLMRDELGMFKYEQAILAKALQIQTILKKREEFEKKGALRQISIFKTEAFPLALAISRREYTISFEDWHFWNNNYNKAKPEIERLLPRGGYKKRRRRPRKPRKSLPKND